ncbi:MAG: RNA-binding protein [Xanthobacteraceae bacterium]
MPARAQQTDFDTGPGSAGAGSERLCAVSRTVKPVSEMIRFVVGPNGEAIPDLKRKLPGRGIWITATRSALAEAIRRGVFARGFGRPLNISENLVELTERLLERSALDALAIAGKAGQVVTGFSRVEASLARDRVVAVLHACDAAPDGARKMAGALRRRSEADKRDFPVISAFTSAQLDLALGRSNVIHAALLAGSTAETFIARYARLDRFRTGDPGQRTERNAPKQTP